MSSLIHAGIKVKPLVKGTPDVAYQIYGYVWICLLTELLYGTDIIQYLVY